MTRIKISETLRKELKTLSSGAVRDVKNALAHSASMDLTNILDALCYRAAFVSANDAKGRPLYERWDDAVMTSITE